MTLELLTLGQFAVALLMGLAALCAFVWAIASGALADVERTKYQVLRAESPAEKMGGSERPPSPPSLGAPMLRRGAPRERAR